jgi:hypothetical protein
MSDCRGFQEKWRRRSRVACACLLLAAGLARTSHGATLQSLLAGGTLDVGNSRFSQWQLLLLDSTAGTVPDLSLIVVNPLAGNPLAPAIQFAAGSQLTTSGINAIEMVLRYRVDAIAGSYAFTGQTLEIGSIAFNGAREVAQVSSELSDGVAFDLGATIVFADHAENLTQLTDTEAFAPKSQVFVTTNVFVAGTASGDSATLGGMVQRLAQSGAPGTPGDYNQNGAVDAADYTIWRNRLGAPAGTLPNDTSGGVIGVAQYNLWKARFGIAGSAAGSLSSTEISGVAVPEPAIGMLLLGAVWMGRLRRRSPTVWPFSV